MKYRGVGDVTFAPALYLYLSDFPPQKVRGPEGTQWLESYTNSTSGSNSLIQENLDKIGEHVVSISLSKFDFLRNRKQENLYLVAWCKTYNVLFGSASLEVGKLTEAVNIALQ
jgi:hypothetical protein